MAERAPGIDYRWQVGRRRSEFTAYCRAGSADYYTAGTRMVRAHDGTWVTPDHLCPDLLRWENIGAADGIRGHVVKVFFWLLRAWPP